ncbi:glycosyltransferase family 4 protein [Dickeya chrysanthemi]|uniref:glycosyltransferase family 4 protein n=1 Tax=Dickeya chrysanthemi TaxID=556 RepID=UPI00067C454A|nr:glycosyltransferase family 1 protein [Dickeya chrysanthemi]
MTFYFDYSTMVGWLGTPTGIPRTVYCLAQELSVLVDNFTLVAIDDNLKSFHHVELTDKGCVIKEKVDFINGDVFFSAGANWAFSCYNAEIKRLKNIGVQYFQLYYDIIPDLFPYFYKDGAGFGDYIGRWVDETSALCDHSFSISECTKRDIVSRSRVIGIDMSGMTVVRLGDDFVADPPSFTGRSRYSEGERFILCVGTLEIRKNQVALLHAYRILNERHSGSLPKLVLVGRQGWSDGDIIFQVANDRTLSKLVDVITDASDIELNWLYTHCLFTLFPALYEGWGLPVAESLWHGKPCISSNTSSMLEIAPELTLFASPYSVESWVERMESLLFKPGVLAMQTERVKHEYVPIRWRDTATTIRDVIFNRV